VEEFLQARCPSCHPTNSIKALKDETCILDIMHRPIQLMAVVYAESLQVSPSPSTWWKKEHTSTSTTQKSSMNRLCC